MLRAAAPPDASHADTRAAPPDARHAEPFACSGSANVSHAIVFEDTNYASQKLADREIVFEDTTQTLIHRRNDCSSVIHPR